MAANDRQRNRLINRWLQGRARSARRWTLMTNLAGFAMALVLVLQASQIASIIYRVVFKKADVSDCWLAIVLLVVAVLLRMVLSGFQQWSGVQASVEVRRELRNELIAKLSRLGPGYTGSRRAGELSTQMLEQVEALDGFVAQYLPQMTLCVAMPLVILLAVLPMNWAAALILLATAPLIPLFMAIVGMKAADANRRNFQAMASLGAHFLDVVQGLATLKLFQRSKSEARTLGEVSEEFRRRTMQVLRLAFLSSAVLEFFAAISIAILAVYLGFSFLGSLDFGSWSGEVNLYQALFMLVLAPEFYQPLRDLGTHYHARQEAVAAGDRLIDLLDEAEQWQVEGEGSQTISAPVSVQFDNVHARYPGRDEDVLRGINLTLNSGELVAVVGPSGAGKSTLMNLLLGFMPASDGEIRINDVPFAQLGTDSWLKQVAWVSQRTALFSGSVRDNLLLADPEATQERLREVCDQARVSEFLPRLSAGLDTQLGENGAGLSGGQIQRIALARAFLKDAPVVLLDEPTANLDNESEQLVLESLRTLCAGRTVLMLTHRVRSMVEADRILLLRDGQLQPARIDRQTQELVVVDNGEEMR